MERGYVQIYTGDGKGKTTAALGLALRAAGAGLKIHIVQFMKGQHYSELDALEPFEGRIAIEQYGDPEFCSFSDPPASRDVARAMAALQRARELLGSGECDVLIMDEALTACLFRLIGEDDLLGVMEEKSQAMELVLTGRGATPRLIERADLVTEMREIKHYYRQGVLARRGIES